MPIFTTAPPELPDGFVFRIVRTPADRPFQAIVTCIEPVGSNTHFANNRTIPCEGFDACPLCNDGFSKRWHGYVSCLVPTTLEHCLFEFTAHAADSFKNYIELHTTIRACVFRVPAEQTPQRPRDHSHHPRRRGQNTPTRPARHPATLVSHLECQVQ